VEQKRSSGVAFVNDASYNAVSGVTEK